MIYRNDDYRADIVLDEMRTAHFGEGSYSRNSYGKYGKYGRDGCDGCGDCDGCGGCDDYDDYDDYGDFCSHIDYDGGGYDGDGYGGCGGYDDLDENTRYFCPICGEMPRYFYINDDDECVGCSRCVSRSAAP